MKSIFLLGLTAGLTLTTQAADYSLLFGGGPSPDRTQYSIESNVIWINQILTESGMNGHELLFGSNQNNANEVQYSVTHDLEQPFALLAEVLGNGEANRMRYRPAQIGSTLTRANSKDGLTTTLTEQIGQLQTGDSLLLTYSGHGGKRSDVRENYLYLWNDTEFSVSELADELAEAPSDSTVRFIFPQCYSGSYNRLAFRNLDPENGVKDGAAICGFTSVADDRISEGCTSSVNTADYRDYATSLFSAVSGQDRLGNETEGVRDRDQDGRISLLEAHYFSYTHNYSTDIPRATSEDFLLSLEHWPLTFASYQAMGVNNIYMDLAEELATDYSQTPGTRDFLNAVGKQVQSAHQEAADIRIEYRQLQKDTDTLRRTLRNRLYLQWPELAEPGTEGFVQAVDQELPEIDRWLRSQPEVSKLIEYAEKDQELNNAIIGSERELSRHQRISRALKLSRLHDFLYNKGSAENKRSYEALLNCENWTIPVNEN